MKSTEKYKMLLQKLSETIVPCNRNLNQIASPLQGGVHKLRLQHLAFFDHLPPSVYIFYGIKVYKKSIILTTYPPSSCKRSLWMPPYLVNTHDFYTKMSQLII